MPPEPPASEPRQLSLFERLRPAVESLAPALDKVRRAVAAARPQRRPQSRPAPALRPAAKASRPLPPPAAPSTGGAPLRRRPRLRTQGRSCDLGPLLDDLNERFFAGALTASITWGRRRPRRRPRRRRSSRISMQLGSYHPDQDLIRIHPALDRPWVPVYVLEAIIHHELLHAALPITTRNGRRRLHTPEFRRRERQFPDHERAQAWIRDNLKRLIEDA